MTKVGVIGLGFVGDAIYHSLSTKDTGQIEVFGYDKYKLGGIGKFDDILDCKWVFVCLPTPYDDKLGRYNLEPFDEVFGQLRDKCFSGLLLIKSTVEPGTCQKLADQYGLRIVHNPEFLTARTARRDFEQQSHIVLGFTELGGESSDESTGDDDRNDLKNMYQWLYPQAHISMVTSAESESMKLFVNNFYATKVQLFTEFYLLCERTGANYGTVVDLMLRNGWISPHHVEVPGPDGKVSYGGFCFPKDTQALLSFMKRVETRHGVLEAVVKERNEMRDD